MDLSRRLSVSLLGVGNLTNAVGASLRYSVTGSITNSASWTLPERHGALTGPVIWSTSPRLLTSTFHA